MYSWKFAWRRPAVVSGEEKQLADDSRRVRAQHAPELVRVGGPTARESARGARRVIDRGVSPRRADPGGRLRAGRKIGTRGPSLGPFFGPRQDPLAAQALKSRDPKRTKVGVGRTVHRERRVGRERVLVLTVRDHNGPPTRFDRAEANRTQRLEDHRAGLDAKRRD